MNLKQTAAMLEAVLFASAEPIEIEKISDALELDELYVKQALEALSKELDERQSGLMLLCLENKYQLVTRKEYAGQIRNVLAVKRNAPLSQAALEVLAVIAYNQPVTKSFVEQVRGVDCSGVVASLCQKGLIEEQGRLELPGRPLVYATTSNFLRCFCMSSLDELPKPDKKDDIKDENGEKEEKNISDEQSDFD